MSKDIVLFVNAIRPATFDALHAYQQQTGRVFTPVVLVDAKIQASITERNLQKQLTGKFTAITADFDSPASMRQALLPIADRIFAVTSQYENSVLELKKLIPYVPYLKTPTETSLEWSTEKKLMRQALESYDSSLVPLYTEVTDSSAKTVQEIEDNMTYPLIVKPSGLEGSLLVTRVNNKTELRKTLVRTFGAMRQAYDKWIKRQKPMLLVEEFMEGDMYSVDSYVAADGTCRHTPPVKVITGHKAGYDDFFGYMQGTPSDLDTQEISQAYDAAERACKAVGLRSVTAHIELMKTASGWKIIELGPRIGGFRHDIYRNSYGINHIVNDILNRGGETPIIPSTLKAHSMFLNIYARSEGTLHSIRGLQHLKQLPSFVSVAQNIQVGDEARFAKNNGDPVLVVGLCHEDEAQFQKDVQAVEEVLHLEVKTPTDLPEAYTLEVLAGTAN